VTANVKRLSVTTTERLIRFADLTPAQSSQLQIATTVEDGHPVEPMRTESPTWLAISSVADGAAKAHYILYFLTSDGKRLDFSQKKTLTDAIAEVGATVSATQWKECSLTLNDDNDRIPRQSVA
jgi:hypothetical protein